MHSAPSLQPIAAARNLLLRRLHRVFAIVKLMCACFTSTVNTRCNCRGNRWQSAVIGDDCSDFTNLLHILHYMHAVALTRSSLPLLLRVFGLDTHTLYKTVANSTMYAAIYAFRKYSLRHRCCKPIADYNKSREIGETPPPS